MDEADDEEEDGGSIFPQPAPSSSASPLPLRSHSSSSASASVSAAIARHSRWKECSTAATSSACSELSTRSRYWMYLMAAFRVSALVSFLSQKALQLTLS